MHTPDGSYVDPECHFQMSDHVTCEKDLTCFECGCCDEHCYCEYARHCTFPYITVAHLSPEQLRHILRQVFI